MWINILSKRIRSDLNWNLFNICYDQKRSNPNGYERNRSDPNYQVYLQDLIDLIYSEDKNITHAQLYNLIEKKSHTHKFNQIKIWIIQ